MFVGRVPNMTKMELSKLNALDINDGIDILLRQYHAVQERMDAYDYSDASFGVSQLVAVIQLEERQQQMRHVFDMLNIDYTKEIK